ncbi:MAG: DUF4845 domain-containing protein [Gammaproteobacteria bacterium]
MRESINYSIKDQHGLTIISWLVVLVFLLFQAVIAMNVLPVYITDSSVKNIMEVLPTDPKAQGLTKRDLKVLVAKRLRMNSVYDVDSKNVTVKKGRGVNIVTIEYEPRGKLIGNLDYIVSFKHEARVPSR